MREAVENKAGIDLSGPLLTSEEAESVINDCMKVLFYRDARSINKVRPPSPLVRRLPQRDCLVAAGGKCNTREL